MTYEAPKYPRIAFENDARRKLTKEDIEEIKSLYKQGWSFKRIGLMFGVAPHAVHYHADPEWAREKNKQRYQALKKQLANMTEEEKKQRYHEQNQRFLERTKTDPLAKEFKAKHTYKWKKTKYHTDDDFKAKTRTQALEKYNRDRQTQPEKLRERWRRSRLNKER